MKLQGLLESGAPDWSHPAGVRGLKRSLAEKATATLDVAPRRGAWIETQEAEEAGLDLSVAPRRGAWIETLK